MKKTFYSLLLAASVLFVACQKEQMPVDQSQTETQEQEFSEGTLISATKVGEVSFHEACHRVPDQYQKACQELIKLSIFGEDLINLNIVTYRIKYWSVASYHGKEYPAKLYGDVSFLVNTASDENRTLESVTLYHTFYNTSSRDVEYGEEIANLRAIYNALVVFPLYQGGFYDPNYEFEDNKFVVAPMEYIYKAKQAIDCEIAALEFIEKLENVQMAEDYYTEVVGISNGGGPALATQYLLESGQDKDYSAKAEKINLYTTYVGEGNCYTKPLFNLLLSEYKSSSSILVGDIDMNSLASVAYVSAVAGSYKTWMKHDSKVRGKYFTEQGKALYDEYVANESSLMEKAFEGEGLPLIKDVVNPDLYEGSSFKECDEINALYETFAKNEAIISGWTPKSYLKIAHSYADEFLLYDTNYKIWKDLSNSGWNCKVKLETIYGLGHLDASMFFMFTDVILKKHPF